MGNKETGRTDDVAVANGESGVSGKDWLLNGAFQHSIDPKGRVIIPQIFRDQLGDSIIVSVNTAQDSIAVYPEEVWTERANELKLLARKKRALEPVAARFSRLSYRNCTFDQQGRVLIPALLRELFIKDAMSVRVSGAFDHVLIVSEEQAKMEDARFASGEIDILALIDESAEEG